MKRWLYDKREEVQLSSIIVIMFHWLLVVTWTLFHKGSTITCGRVTRFDSAQGVLVGMVNFSRTWANSSRASIVFANSMLFASDEYSRGNP